MSASASKEERVAGAAEAHKAAVGAAGTRACYHDGVNGAGPVKLPVNVVKAMLASPVVARAYFYRWGLLVLAD